MKSNAKRVTTSQVALVAITVGFLGAGIVVGAEAQDWGVAESGLIEKVDHGLAGRAVTVRFGELTDPRTPLTSTDILVGGSNPANLFSGDLFTPGYSGLRFRVAGDGSQPQSVDVMISRVDRHGRGRSWHHSGVTFSDQAGEWTVIRIPLDPNKGWHPSHVVGSRYTAEETWEMDLRAVDAIFVRITREGLPPQTFSLADFQLVGNGEGAITEPATLSLLEDYFDVASHDEIDRTVDSNGDGMSDYDALRAGLDPRDPNSTFAASVAVAADGNTISWPGVLYGNYAIMRSNDLRQGTFNVIGTRLAGYTGTQTWDDENPVEGLPNFYKVVKY